MIKSKIYKSSYRIKLTACSEFCVGQLLLFDFGNDLIGYSDFLPLVSFGELSSEKQLENLKQGKESLRLSNARDLALQDAQARKNNQSLFKGLEIPLSHFLIEDLFSFSNSEDIRKFSHEFVKVKLKSTQRERQIQIVKKIHSKFSHIKWRLDFNGSLNFYDWKKWYQDLSFLESKIDFIEDPFISPSDFKKEGLSFFAEDWIQNPSSFIRIVKPLRDSVSQISAESRWKRVLFTHGFDHPLGQMANVFLAAQFYKKHPSLKETGGFKCFAYEDNDFCFRQDRSSHFKLPEGFGLGFQKELENQNWERVL